MREPSRKMTHLPCKSVTCMGWLFNCFVLSFSYQTVGLYLFIFLLPDVLLVVLVCKFVVIKKMSFYKLLKNLFIIIIM